MNTKLLNCLGRASELYPIELEQRFPRLVGTLGELWGSAEFEPFIQELMLDARNGRQGFPPEVVMELFRLAEAYKGQAADGALHDQSAWDDLPEDNRRGTRGDWSNWD